MKNKFLLLSTASILSLVSAYQSNEKGWKVDENGNIVIKDGNPVFLHTSGQEQTVNGNTIADLNTEAKNYRIAKEKAEEVLKKFEGLDPEKAREALGTIDKIDKKKLLDAGEVDRVRKEISDSFTAQLTEQKTLNDSLQSRINEMTVSSVFKDSELLRDGIAVPRDMVEATFRSNFKVGADGKIEVLGKDGNRLFSKEKMGEFASPEEGLRLLIEGHPSKDQILKANVGNGSGNEGGGGARGKGNVIKRAEFDKLPPMQRAEAATKMGKGELQVVD